MILEHNIHHNYGYSDVSNQNGNDVRNQILQEIYQMTIHMYIRSKFSKGVVCFDIVFQQNYKLEAIKN